MCLSLYLSLCLSVFVVCLPTIMSVCPPVVNAHLIRPLDWCLKVIANISLSLLWSHIFPYSLTNAFIRSKHLLLLEQVGYILFKMEQPFLLPHADPSCLKAQFIDRCMGRCTYLIVHVGRYICLQLYCIVLYLYIQGRPSP